MRIASVSAAVITASVPLASSALLVLTAIMAVNYTMLLVVFLAVGPVTNAFGARAVYSIAAGSLVVAAVVATRLLPREDVA